ncbi:MAG: YihY/virulence factor BrkB family protein [Candidatus Rokubacteria bacterium]|nr:YihY/virulence factor BrkB family protein [Candidatus Rokubacteria bacterium]
MFAGARGAVSRFFAADGFFLSAGLAFFFLVAMIPLLLLSVSIVGFVLTTEQAGRELVSQLTRNFPVYRNEISRALLRIVETRKTSGLVGTVILIVFSTPLFTASRLVLHRLMGIKTGRGFLRGLAVDAGMVILLGILLFALMAITWAFYWFQLFVLGPANLSGQWLAATTLGFSLLLSMALFYLGYRFVPMRRMRPGAALAGALVATLLWEVAKQLFRLYIREFGVYDQIYGTLGVLVAFVMFIYYSAVVFVLGGAYAAALDATRPAR